MSLSLVVLVAHICAVSQVSPFLVDCSTQPFPIKGATVQEAMANCKTEMKKVDKQFKKYFSDERESIGHREYALVGPLHCELQREHNWEKRAKGHPRMDKVPLGNGRYADPDTGNITEEKKKDSDRDIQKELNEVSPVI